MNLNLERVLRFVAVAEHQSFTRAATALRIDQPWLSRQVMQLEEQLGFSLFDRSGAKIVLTPRGQEFYDVAKTVAESAELVRTKAEDMKRNVDALLKIGLSYATFPLETRENLLDAYRKLRPKVKLELSSFEWSGDVADLVTEGRLDFGLVVGPVVEKDLEGIVLERLLPCLAIPNEDPLAGADAVAFEELKGRRIAIGSKDPASRSFQAMYSWVGGAGAEPVILLEGRRFIREEAQRDRLVYISYAKEETLPSDFRRVPIRGQRPEIELSLVRSRRTMSPVGERFWRLAETMAGKAAKA